MLGATETLGAADVLGATETAGVADAPTLGAADAGAVATGVGRGVGDGIGVRTPPFPRKIALRKMTANTATAAMTRTCEALSLT